MSSEKCKTCANGSRAGWYSSVYAGKKTGKGGFFYRCDAGVDNFKYGDPKECRMYEPKEKKND